MRFNNSLQQKLLDISKYIFFGLLAYMPFHIFIATTLGSSLGVLGPLKVLKDVVLVFGFCLLFGISLKQSWFKNWIKNWLVIVIVVYALHTLLLAAFRPTDIDAEILGITFNLRYLIFFLYAWLLTKWLPVVQLQKTALKVVFASALGVVSIGLIQYFILPIDFLAHFGYSKANGVLPSFLIDNKPDLVRIMSTIRDPNSLGSYLVIILSLLTARILQTKRKDRIRWYAFWLMSALALFLTFSRSALLGLGLSVAIFSSLFIKNKMNLSRTAIRNIIIIVVAMVGILAAGLFVMRDSYFVKNTVFHADERTVEESPNQKRLRFTEESIQMIKDVPVGYGPGTAGSASQQNNIQGSRLTENYYLQLALEVGIVGLVLFLIIAVMVAINLLGQSHNLYALALLSSLAGLALTNMFLHIWSNEAVAYIWWGLAGLYYPMKNNKVTN